MQQEITTIYCLCADFLSAIGHRDDPQCQMSTAEVMTTALVAAAFFHGHQERSRLFLKEHGYIPTMLSKSRFNRRLHQIEEALWLALFALMGQVAQQLNPEQVYLVDSLPVAVCDNIRIRRCRLYQDQAHRGYCASKRRYFYGLKVHLVVTASGQPVEFLLTPGSENDLRAFKRLGLHLPPGATLYADRGYTDYLWEALLAEVAAIDLVAQRKKNSLWPHPGYVEYLRASARKRVETTFSLITKEFERSIHAVTDRGFELKIFLTILAFAIIH